MVHHPHSVDITYFQRMRTKILGVLLLFLIVQFSASGQSKKQQWVDSVFNTMDESAKIGQLFMIAVSSHLDDDRKDDVEKQIKNRDIGGVLFTSGHPKRQVALTNKLQRTSDVPLFIAFDATQNIGSLLDSTLQFPAPLALAAIESDSLFYAVSKELARESKLLGVNLNLGPTANLYDPAAGYMRPDLFGDDKFSVSRRLLLFTSAFSSQGILSCAKHFPIQGITITDIDKGIPVIHPFVDSVQAFPFKQLFNHGLQAVMPAASELPVFYEKKKAARKNKLSSDMLSSFFAGDWIKKEMKFNGLVIVDIRTLESASDALKNGEAELFAFQAGNDVLLTNNNPAPAIRRIRKLLKKQKQYVTQLNNSVRKILSAKYDAEVFKGNTIEHENILLHLNSPEARVLQQHAVKAAVTVVKNAQNTIPIRTLENRKFATLIIGDTTGLSVFTRMIRKYVAAKTVFVVDEKDVERIEGVIKKYDVVFVPVTSSTPPSLLEKAVPYLTSDDPEKELVIADLGCSALQRFTGSFNTIISTFTNQREMTKAVPQIIFGGLGAEGVLPITMGSSLSGTGIKTRSLQRFQYSIPEDAGLDRATLKQIDAIASEAIEIGGTPGCNVFVARHGKVIYEKSYGFLTYENQTAVTDSTIYDLASITKVSATLQAVMFLYDRGMLDINKKASFYLPELKNSNKKDATVKDILTHQAGLWPFLPFWAQTMKDTTYLPMYYSRKPTLKYPYLVADRLYATSAMRDSLWSWIIHAKVREKPARTPYDYKYSDMGFYIMQHLSERLLNQPLEDFVSQNLYEPLGASTTGYLPLTRFSVSRIAPTENDKVFRRTLLIGTVHDQGAAMAGGVAGHAGLFSTAGDLAKLGQMLLQEGYYGGYRYYKPETIQLFTNKQFETSRRGLGWDKPAQSDAASPTSIYASPRTFGHTGFTGTCIWVDPEFDLVFVFLSNRVHPDMNNTKLLNANIRTRIQDVVYQSIFDFCKTKPPVGEPEEYRVKSASR